VHWNETDTALITRVCHYIQCQHPKTITLEQLSRQFHMSPYHLQRTFKHVMGISPRQFAEGLRIADFKSKIRQGEKITDAMYSAGFGSSSRLYERSNEQLGMTPSTYRKKGKGMTIFYGVVDCPLGKLLVAVTERGVCKMSLGDDAEILVQDFAREFELAECIRDDDGVGYWTAQVVQYLDGATPHLDLPLDIQATAFQLKVWQTLQTIPIGETRTYSDIAEAIGQPTATRAVANACAKNPVALVIPCHRIIRKDRSLGGYRWGIERKATLLEQEQAYREQHTTDE
jgi:AraC family transcriptional regulator of adaptative response/methylated-DNA-[protein]-cysteine methyltransferase